MATLASTYNTPRYPSRTVTWEGPAQAREPERAETAIAQEPPRTVRISKLRRPSVDLRPALLFTLNALHQALDWGLLAGIGLFLVLFGLQFPHAEQWDRAWWVVQIRAVGDPIVVRVLVWIKLQWPTFSGAGYLPLGLALASWMSKNAVAATFMPILSSLRKRIFFRKAAPDSAVLQEGETAAVVDSEQARGRLLRRYREIEEALSGAKRKRCALLSIDVVGSTQLKESEGELPITITFQAYMNMLEEIFLQHGAWKQAWTPDGVMVCFLHPDMAVAAAQRVLERLRTFNRTENLLRTRLSVRCGLNEGEVPIYEDSRLEKIAHQVIDITGHMQKQANPNTLWLSAETHRRLHDKSGFKPTARKVDGHQVYEWSPSLSLPEQPPAVLVPQPKAGDSDPTWA